MLGWILNICYSVLIVSVLPMLVWKRIRYGKYREGWAQKLWGSLPRNSEDSPLIWLHAVSVGEVLLLRPIVARIRTSRPDCRLFISTTTATGYQLLAEKFPDCQRAYFPLDFTWAVRRALNRVRPDLVILAELELWPNFLRELKSREIPVMLINARLGQRSFQGYRRVKFLFEPLLNAVRMIGAQTAEYAERFVALGVPAERVRVTGSIKFDGLQTSRTNPATQALRDLFRLEPHAPVWVAGSTQDPEESIVLKVFQNLQSRFPDLRLILVPRHPERAGEIAAHIAQSGATVWRRTQGKVDLSSPGSRDIILMDTVGELGACWGLATVAFVGGSLGNRGGQNMIEPAAYGSAVCFGPNTWNFKQVVELLLENSAAEVVRDAEEMLDCLSRLLAHPEQARALGDRARRLVLAQAGATDRTVELLTPLLPQKALKGKVSTGSADIPRAA